MEETSKDFVSFGKYKGERWTRIPIHYLRWLIDVNSHWSPTAKMELKRRGTVLEHEIILSGHAIDRFYLRYGKSGIRRDFIKSQGGIYSCLYKMAKEALDKSNGCEKVSHEKLKFVFSYGELDTTLVTVI